MDAERYFEETKNLRQVKGFGASGNN